MVDPVRLIRAASAVAAGALVPALLLSTPSFAAVTAPATAAAASDTGSPYDETDVDDLRVAIARTLADPAGGQRVIQEANALLDNGTPEQKRARLATGHRLAQAEDDNVAIARTLADPAGSQALRAAAGAALDDDTPEALRHFLEVGRYEV
ncbi:hypothetical protein ACH4F6_28245 [Streptomyces sp. NPDC017936]|uniref:hypothetical protein n=1 Tax=Streptomyces sp. NPDC017936 TaxID=3365016 RepID=UPI0037A9F722